MNGTPLQEAFGPGGCLAQALDGYSYRQGQVAMAEAVETAIHEQRHLLVEAPRGIGRALAYAVPATWYAAAENQQVVIVTDSPARQHQLLTRELPLLASCLPWDVGFAALKGLSSYLCLAKLARVREASVGGGTAWNGAGEPLFIRELLAWAGRTETGDVAELLRQPSPEVWSALSIHSEDCTAAHCPFHDRCHGRRASEAARRASVVVTSYSILFALAHAREAGGKRLQLPKLEVLVLDQAHRAADIARSSLGWRLGMGELARVSRPLRELGLGWLAEALEREALAFCHDLARLRRSVRYQEFLREPDMVRTLSLVRRLRMVSERFHGAAETASDRDENGLALLLERYAHRCELLTQRVQGGIELEDPELVVSINEDARGRGVLVAQRFDVAPLLRERIFEPARSVILVSDTLTADGSFSMMRDELGVPDPVELLRTAERDPEGRSLLVVPEGLPYANDRSWPIEVARQVAKVTDLVDGRVLCLFGSQRTLEFCQRGLRRAHRPVLVQGEASPVELLACFAAEPGAILICTPAWWASSDPPESPIACVVLDRLPFTGPDDPLHAARRESDHRWFGRWALPHAVLNFRRICGLPAQQPGDRKALVVLDRRLVDEPYGRFFLRSLPLVLRSRCLEDLRTFLDAHPPRPTPPGEQP